MDFVLAKLVSPICGWFPRLPFGRDLKKESKYLSVPRESYEGLISKQKKKNTVNKNLDRISSSV